MKIPIVSFLAVAAVALVTMLSADGPGSESETIETRIGLEQAHLTAATLIDGKNLFSVTADSGRIALTDALARRGDASLEFRLAPGETRAEAKIAAIPNNEKKIAGFSVYFPKDFAPPRHWSIFAQWWQGAETSPNIAFELDDTDPDRLGMRVISRSGSSRSNEYATHYKGELPTETWIDFMIEFRVDDSGGENGVLRVWRDGTLIVDYAGKLGYTDQLAYSGFRVGLYRSARHATEERVYFDEIFVWDL